MMQKWTRLKYQPNIPLEKEKGRVTESPEHRRLSKEAAKEGMVLLKNEKGALPLKKGSRVVLLGKGTFDYVKGGGGSGDVTVSYIHNLYDGLKQQGDNVSVEPRTAKFYKEYVEEKYADGYRAGMLEEPELPEELLSAAAHFADTAILSFSRFSGEGWDRTDDTGPQVGQDRSENDPLYQYTRVFPRGDYYLTDRENRLVEQVKERFSRVVVVLNVGSAVDTEWFIRDPKISAVLLAWQGGMEGGIAAAELLTGMDNPSGKLADTLVRALADYPSTAGFHESEDYVNYNEDIYVGYRYFETIPEAADRVNYPFGYGMSYTTFSIENVAAKIEKDMVTVSADVCNTGDCEGKEVIQVYYSAPQGRLGKPSRELAAYRKTRALKPGEIQRVTLRFSVEEMASYDDLGKICASAYVLEKGIYRFFVGNSVRNTIETGEKLILNEDRIVEKLSARLVPTDLKERMLADGTMEFLPEVKREKPVSVLKDIPLEKGIEPDVKEVLSAEGHDREKTVLFGQVAEGKTSMDEFIAILTDAEIADLLGGQPNTGVANTFGFGNLGKYGVPNAMTADGPAGLRIQQEAGVCTTAWPCATLLACTWNPELVERVGAAGAAEVKENNIAAWLMPAINIHRNPLCGRNFEYYSEDPLLAGRQAAAMVRGVQSRSIVAAVKHFAFNNKETNRVGSDSRVSERAAREIYLKAFEIVVKESKVWSVMTSYKIVNGIYTSENADLLTGILRGEWGFEGLVMTDWWNRGEQYLEILAGNDLKMGRGYPKRLLEAVKREAITRREMEVSAKRVLELLLKLD